MPVADVSGMESPGSGWPWAPTPALPVPGDPGQVS